MYIMGRNLAIPRGRETAIQTPNINLNIKVNAYKWKLWVYTTSDQDADPTSESKDCYNSAVPDRELPGGPDTRPGRARALLARIRISEARAVQTVAHSRNCRQFVIQVGWNLASNAC